MNETHIHTAVINDEEQYSVWPLHLPLPAGWYAVGDPGSRDSCLKYVEQVWTDMRPASLRTAMAEDEAR